MWCPFYGLFSWIITSESIIIKHIRLHCKILLGLLKIYCTTILVSPHAPFPLRLRRLCPPARFCHLHCSTNDRPPAIATAADTFTYFVTIYKLLTFRYSHAYIHTCVCRVTVGDRWGEAWNNDDYLNYAEIRNAKEIAINSNQRRKREFLLTGWLVSSFTWAFEIAQSD